MLRINDDRDARRLQLRRHRVEIPDAKVDHPHLLGIAEVPAGLWKWTERGRPPPAGTKALTRNSTA